MVARTSCPCFVTARPTDNPLPPRSRTPANQIQRTILSSHVFRNDLLGRCETISQGGSVVAMLKLGENKVGVAYNDHSEVTGATTRMGDIASLRSPSGQPQAGHLRFASIPVAQQAYEYDGIGTRTTAERYWAKGKSHRQEERRRILRCDVPGQFRILIFFCEFGPAREGKGTRMAHRGRFALPLWPIGCAVIGHFFHAVIDCCFRNARSGFLQDDVEPDWVPVLCGPYAQGGFLERSNHGQCSV